MAYSGDMVKCPHCECKVRLSDVENDDGFCPECGQLVMNSSLADTLDEDELYEDDQLLDDEDEEFEDDDDDMERDVLDELNDEDFGFDDDDEMPGTKPGKRSLMGNIPKKKRGRKARS